ncbi:MAG TPA: GNAT family N-acetyltransferase [Acidimicrobiales bacterium]|nr:GNAT family N-acetyltransferase [Acidimicrobiales bacterium]
MRRVRPAVVGDGPAMGRIHVEAWRAAYRGQMPDSYLDSLDEEQRGREWTDRLAHSAASPRSVRHLVSEDDDGVIGIATLGFERGGRDPARGELWMINVAPSTWGSGVGTELIAAAEAELRRIGYHSAVLWTLETNVPARRFYEKRGWEADGAVQQDDFTGAPLTEVRYAKQLS